MIKMKISLVLVSVMVLDFQVARCGMADGEILSMEDGDKAKALEMQNQIRRAIFPPASNMRKLFWDDGLANKCEDIVALCPEKPDHTIRATKNFTDTTVNLYYKENVYEFMPVAAEAFREWNSRSDVGSNVERQYLRLRWASSSRVGCSAAYCGYGGLICCKYGPTALDPSMPVADLPVPYAPDVESCSGCEKTDFCEDKLCVSCAEQNVTAPASCATEIDENTTSASSTSISPASTTSTIPTLSATAGDGDMSTKPASTSTSGGVSCWTRRSNTQSFTLIALLISLLLGV